MCHLLGDLGSFVFEFKWLKSCNAILAYLISKAQGAWRNNMDYCSVLHVPVQDPVLQYRFYFALSFQLPSIFFFNACTISSDSD